MKNIFLLLLLVICSFKLSSQDKHNDYYVDLKGDTIRIKVNRVMSKKIKLGLEGGWKTLRAREINAVKCDGKVFESIKKGQSKKWKICRVNEMGSIITYYLINDEGLDLKTKATFFRNRKELRSAVNDLSKKELEKNTNLECPDLMTSLIKDGGWTLMLDDVVYKYNKACIK